jgi:CBS domain-containing protein
MMEQSSSAAASFAARCPSCGEPLPDQARFCRRCGFTLAPAPASIPSNEKRKADQVAPATTFADETLLSYADVDQDFMTRLRALRSQGTKKSEGMLVREIMLIHPICIYVDADMRQAATIVSRAEVSDLMVIDHQKKFVGVLSEGDLLRAILPNFDDVLAAGESLSAAFRFFVKKGRDVSSHSIDALIIRNPITVKPDDDVAQIATIMVQKQIRRLPVVENDLLRGTISRADICRAVISNAE